MFQKNDNVPFFFKQLSPNDLVLIIFGTQNPE